MTTDDASRTFSDDAPKTNPWEQDRLGYRPFSSRLASTILSLQAPNGYVIGLHGAWGSGKSTVLAFVQAFIKKHNDELDDDAKPMLVVDFRPWMISGHQDLVSSFFKVLAEALTSSRAATRRTFWKRLLSFGKVGTAPILDATATLAIVALPLGAPAIKAGAEVAKSSTAKAIDRWLAEPSLQAAYDELREKLAVGEVRILVLIDDIDRLDRSEIKATMQMVKTVGRLPNVIYLLAYDREIVWSALDELAETAAGRPGFAEKIVQHELELPQPAANALLQLFGSEIEFLPIVDVGSSRTQAMIFHGLKRWLRHPRDVSRLSNAVKFAWPALEGEIDPMDLLCMEGLRLFDQQVFSWIRGNREFLLGKLGMRHVTKEQRTAFLKPFKDGLPSATRDDQLDLVCLLFPSHAEGFSDRARFGSEPWPETVKRRGVAYEAGFDAYFSLFPPDGAIRKATIDNAIAALSDEARQVDVLRRLMADREHAAGLVADYLVELQYRFQGRNPAQPTLALLHALFAVGEQVQGLRLDRGFPSFQPAEQLASLVTTMLASWGREHAGQNLMEAFARSASPSFCADIYVERARDLGVIPALNQHRLQTVTHQTLDELGRSLLGKITTAAANGSLASAPFYFDIARSWSHLAGVEAPKAWLSKGAMESAQVLAKIATSILGYSIDPNGRTYSFNTRPDEPFYDLTALLAACLKHAGTANLTADETARIEVLREGLAKLVEKAGAKAADES